jgi:hypothetical protein
LLKTLLRTLLRRSETGRKGGVDFNFMLPF